MTGGQVLVDRPVSTTETYRVAPGYESDFRRWGNAMLQELARSSSFMGGRVLDPDHEGGTWQLEHRWADPDVAARWLESAARARWLAAAAAFARPRRAEQRPLVRVAWSALEPAQPDPDPDPAPGRVLGRAPVRARGRAPAPTSPTPPPPKWKTAVVTLIAMFPPVLFLNVTLIPRLGGVNILVRTMVFCAGVAVALTWVMMPRLMPLLNGWLNSAQGVSARRGVPVRATIDGQAHADTELLTRGPTALGTARADSSLVVSADSYLGRWDPSSDPYPSSGGRAGYLRQSSQSRRRPR
jgi:antibiotic biosynthesis monooxygenase (ABM) superfamily enzyme